METCFNYCYFKPEDKGAALFSSDEKRWINRIRKLIEKYPDQITVLAEPETNDGCIYVKLPSSWLKVQPLAKREYTEEERREIGERLRRAHASSGLPSAE